MKTIAIAAVAAIAFVGISGMASAQDANAEAEAAYKDIQAAYGFVPGFVKAYPKQAIAGAWQMSKALAASPENKLEPKVKSLINLAVAAQIPCRYCIWIETKMAKNAGATDAEVSEAVAQAAYVRHWSTVLNGMQIDFNTYKKEFGGE